MAMGQAMMQSMTNNSQPQQQNNISNQPVQNEKKCPNCNELLPANAKFCLNCGTKINQEIFCNECGCKNPATAKFCSNCGYKF